MRTLIVGLIVLSSTAVWSAQKMQPLNIRVGLWEVTTTITTSGEMPIPAEMLSRMTPEQRAKMEERRKAMSGEKTRTTTSKNCMTKEKLERGEAFRPDQQGCTQTVVTSTSSKAEVRVACEKSDTKNSGSMQIEALSPENVKGSGIITMTDGGHTMNIHTTFTSKWLGPACGSVM